MDDRCAKRVQELLTLTRPQASLMAGEMTAQEWRTVEAILRGLRVMAAAGEFSHGRGNYPKLSGTNNYPLRDKTT